MLSVLPSEFLVSWSASLVTGMDSILDTAASFAANSLPLPLSLLLLAPLLLPFANDTDSPVPLALASTFSSLFEAQAPSVFSNSTACIHKPLRVGNCWRACAKMARAVATLPRASTCLASSLHVRTRSSSRTPRAMALVTMAALVCGAPAFSQSSASDIHWFREMTTSFCASVFNALSTSFGTLEKWFWDSSSLEAAIQMDFSSGSALRALLRVFWACS
mmetsp:Transcript_18007/g.39257  ORF Transcript_18007/g.39257 Transcript_18007/m.39257 type:complete len:219 (+) Transcript_18007:1792-2448(+)